MKEIGTGLSKWFNTVNDVDKLVNIDTKQNNKQNRNTMAREILFKAKLADTGKWIVGQRVILCNQTYIIPENQQFRHPGDPDIENSFIEVIPETVCQFSGLPDKNGVKVFEGDNVRVNGSMYDTVTVKYLDGAFCIGIDGIMPTEFNSFVTIRDAMAQADKVGRKYEMVVVGNIHDKTE